MAQTEDTELRDLVIEALEKNGSLAKIRALLRANVFLVFEDEYENIKQNVSLDNILKLPEGSLCLSIVHDFLEFCNLKNTLFVYKAESRQRKDYNYEGQRKLAEKLNLLRNDNIQEPILITLLKQVLRSSHHKLLDQNDLCNFKSQEKSTENIFKDDQNCTYIVHEDSNTSTTSNSQSDNSSDEKNKLHLRLQLDNSDTDTSSDSTRDKFSSEYIPNEHNIIDSDKEKTESIYLSNPSAKMKIENNSNIYTDNRPKSNYLQELKLLNNNSSSESTSYIELKPYKPLDEKLINTAGVPIMELDEKLPSPTSVTRPHPKSFAEEHTLPSNINKNDSVSSATLSSGSMKNEEAGTNPKQERTSDVDSVEYSNDFTSSHVTKNKELTDKPPPSPESVQEELEAKAPKNSSFESQNQNSQSSRSSVSISDVADLISEKSLSFSNQTNDNNSAENNKSSSKKSKKSSQHERSKISDDSAEFSESPIPSLSNLSLDIHSD
ncbi:centrosomal protein 43-like [Pectinophora gossypiella]|uniref:Centrosomal protein 43 n=1 Tax=Pectinophora gossypiella TaxID=13191 RepID=A0A1E1W5S3_PECGO|nr:centrosomal protein 43-like [Pectinophora gossypiella]